MTIMAGISATMMVRSYCRRKCSLIFLLLLCLLTGVLLFARHKKQQIKQMSSSLTDGFTNNNKSSSTFTNPNVGCKIPTLDPLHPSIIHLLQTPHTTFCDPRPALTYTLNGFLYINETVREHYYENSVTSGRTRPFGTLLQCCYHGIYRENEGTTDNSFRYDPTCKDIKYKEKLTSEFVRVECFQGIRRVYVNFHAIVLTKPNVEERSSILTKLHQQKTGISSPFPSILVLGVDTVSRISFHRFMTKTLNLLQNKMNAIEMTTYNKVRDNTFPNVVPLLAGIFAHELKNVCWKDKYQSFDGCKFLWNRFVQHGYRTLFAEDAPHLGTFNYMRSGFHWSPTDYYMRPLMLAAQAFVQRKKNLCLGTREETQVILDWLLEFMLKFQNLPYFAFSWIASKTHELPENAILADNFYYNFFHRAITGNLLNNTVIFFLSDHGPRWGKYRETYHGWYEDRLPFSFVVFPAWIKQKYPKLIENVLVNSKHLTTPFDIHETIKDLLMLPEIQSGKMPTPIYSVFPTRGISLLRNIPRSRTCSDASIQEHFCACQTFVNVNATSVVIKNAVSHVIMHINKLLQDHASKCTKLLLSNILEARKFTSSSKTRIQYLVVFKVMPSGGIFEATVLHTPANTLEFKVSGDISRINLYSTQSSCIHDPYLQKYCFCLSNMNNSSRNYKTKLK